MTAFRLVDVGFSQLISGDALNTNASRWWKNAAL